MESLFPLFIHPSDLTQVANLTLLLQLVIELLIQLVKSIMLLFWGIAPGFVIPNIYKYLYIHVDTKIILLHELAEIFPCGPRSIT